MSLRLRLLLSTALVIVVALVAVDVATYAALGSFLDSQIDQRLEAAHTSVEASVSGEHAPGPPGAGALPGGLAGAPGPGQFCPTFDGLDVRTLGLDPGTVIAVRSPEGAPLYQCALPVLGTTSTPLPVIPRTIPGLAAGGSGGQGDGAVYLTLAAAGGGTPFRARASVLATGSAAGDQLVVAVPMTSTSDVLGRLRLLELVVTAIAVLGALLAGLWAVSAWTRPLRRIEGTAEAIAGGSFGERVPGAGERTEVGRLATALNVMLDRIDGTMEDLRRSEARMRRFVADASHELRTPLAAVSAYAELFDRGASERPEDLGRVITGIRSESGRMARLVDDLLLLARLDEGRGLEHAPLDLTLVAAEAVETSRTVGPAWPVTLVADEPVEVDGDAARLRQVLDNLLANARAHCPEGTPVTVSVRGDADGVAVEVSDRGPGIDPADAEAVFDRFVRTDSARSRAHGGAGLGLAIVRSIVEAHGGSVEARPREGGGTTFRVSLPAHAGEPSGPGGDRVPHPPGRAPAGTPAAPPGVDEPAD